MASVVVYLCVVLSLICGRTLVSANEEVCKDCGDKIPIELALRLNTISDEKQLFREFMEGDVEKPIIKVAKFPLALSFSPDSVTDGVDGAQNSSEEPVERKALVKPKDAGCVPELRSISLRDSEDPWIHYWPKCTRLEQCGGCCGHNRLSCQPIETETINFQVIVMEYAENQKVMKYKGKEIVSREKHTKCKCDCIIKEKDCNPLQEYFKNDCRCVCTNKETKAKCDEDSTKHWNSENCTCECLKAVECSTGTYYDQATCSCEALPSESLLVDSFVTPNNSDNRRPPPTRRRWQPNYSFFGGK